MKKTIPLIIVCTAFLACSCNGHRFCYECWSENASGEYINGDSRCEKDSSFAAGFRSGFQEAAAQQGYTVTCKQVLSK